MSGEITFYLAEAFDEISGRYEGLRPQQISTYLPSLNSFIIKDEIAKAHQEEYTSITNTSLIKDVPNNSVNNNNEAENLLTDTNPKTKKQTNFHGSLKLDPKSASLELGKFMNSVMSHLQALPGSEVDITLDIHVKNENGIDKQTSRIVLENSKSLKVDNPEIF